jgi:hypothetical protein
VFLFLSEAFQPRKRTTHFVLSIGTSANRATYYLSKPRA